ncbi:MAG: hypothetical protein EOS21_28520 [Mesorhizobium sp.]|nr:MAG: hypothetical protein EOS21_28520 [Mesorhizobium sp.]
MAAGRAAHDSRVAAGFLAPNESGKLRRSRLNISAVNPSRKPKTDAQKPEPAKSSKTRDKIASCKKRPDSKKARTGDGSGSKKFIPWCG